MKFLLIILLKIIVVSQCYCQDSIPNTMSYPLRIMATGYTGMNLSPGNVSSMGFGLDAFFHTYVVITRFNYGSDREFVFWDFDLFGDSYEPDIHLRDFSAMLGIHTSVPETPDDAFFLAAAGIGYVDGVVRGKEIRKHSDWGTTYYHEPIDVGDFGLALEGRILKPIWPWLGMGLGLSANINSQQSLYSFHVLLHVGKVN